MKISYLVAISLIALTSCANHELDNMGKYQDGQDMNRLKYYQEKHDEQIRKDLKNEHKADIVFNMSVTKEQLEIDEKKFSMLDKFHIDGNEHLTREEIEYYNKWLNKDRARLENEDGIARPDDVPEESPPNNPSETESDKIDRTEVQAPEQKQPEPLPEQDTQQEESIPSINSPPPQEGYSVQHYIVPASDGLPSDGINQGRDIKENGVE